MVSIELQTRSDAILQQIDTLSAILKDVKTRHANTIIAVEKATIALARSEESMTRSYQEKMYYITQRPEWETVKIDPKCDEPTEAWGQMAVDRIIQEDPEWTEVIGKYYETQEEQRVCRANHHESKAEMETVVEQLRTLNSQARLVAALIEAG